MHRSAPVRLCIYEDSGAPWLEPITSTRPAFALWCGAERLFERHRRQFGAHELGFWLRRPLLDLWKLEQPTNPINDADWLREGPTLWINGRWLPDPDERIDATTPHAGLVNEQIAYVVIPGGAAPNTPTLDGWLYDWKQRVPSRNVGGAMLDFLGDVVERNGAALQGDAQWFHTANGPGRPDNIAIEGPAGQCIVALSATVASFVFADTRNGPVLIDEGATIHSFSRLEGPCYVGRGSCIVGGARVGAGTTIGPGCRIGGEVEATVVHGYCNKHRNGFLGHSYVGEWVTLAAGTQSSVDDGGGHDYAGYRVGVNGHRLSTTRATRGASIGDHVKMGVGVLLDCGSTVGAFANVLPAGSLLPRVIPPFCQVHDGQLHDLWDLCNVLDTAGSVMQRCGRTLTQTHKDFYYHLFEATMELRHKMMSEGKMPRLRCSV